MSTLLDHMGRPVDTGRLETVQAGPSVLDSRSPYRQSVAEALNPKRLATLLRQADEGDASAFLVLAEEMEERDLHYASVLSTRRLGVAGLPILVEAASDASTDVAIADEVRALVAEPSFDDLVFDLTDALGKGFAVSEIVWGRAGGRLLPTRYDQRPQRWFQFDGETQTHLRIRSSTVPGGVELAPFRFVTHFPRIRSGLPVRGGLARLACIAFVMKRFTLADWMTFLEVFGMPLRLGRFEKNASKEAQRKLLDACRRLGPEAAAILPREMDIEIKEATRGSGGDKVFEGMASYLDRQVSKGVLGQTMTTDDGSSRAQAQVHDSVRLDIQRADAKQISKTLNRDVIAPFVALNFGAQVAPPRVRLHVATPEDQEKRAKTFQVLAGMGVRIEESWLRDQFGIPDPDEGAEVVGGSPAGARAQPPKDGGQVPDASFRRVPGAQRSAAPEAHSCSHEHGGPELFAKRAAPRDAVDDLRDAYLEGWRTMVDENVGYLERRLRDASSFEEARRILDEEGPKLGLTAITEALARATFAARGVGDATDKPRV